MESKSIINYVEILARLISEKNVVIATLEPVEFILRFFDATGQVIELKTDDNIHYVATLVMDTTENLLLLLINKTKREKAYYDKMEFRGKCEYAHKEEVDLKLKQFEQILTTYSNEKQRQKISSKD